MLYFARGIILASLALRVANGHSPPPRGHMCESRQPVREESGVGGLGRAVDPTRLFGSKSTARSDGTEVVVFVGADGRTLCSLRAADGAFLWATPLVADALGAAVSGEPSTLALTPNSAFVVVVVAAAAASEAGAHTRVGWVQHHLASGQEVARSFFEGTCQSDPASSAGDALPWLRPDWWHRLAVGARVDYFREGLQPDAAAAWVDATLVNRTNADLSLFLPATGETVRVPLAAAATVVQPPLSPPRRT